MSDLIDRQAAISICDNAIDLWNGQLGTGAIVAVRDAIMALPSIQFATDTNVGTKLGTNLAEVGTDLVRRHAAVEALEKCYTCKHIYQRVSDADTLYCRCRKGCRYEEFKPKRSGESPRRHEG